jgi:hypothetical protein
MSDVSFDRGDTSPSAGGWLAGVAFAVQLDQHVGAQDGVLLVAADPLMQLSRRPYSRREGAGIERHKHRIQGQVAGRPLRWWAAAIARCRTA